MLKEVYLIEKVKWVSPDFIGIADFGGVDELNSGSASFQGPTVLAIGDFQKLDDSTMLVPKGQILTLNKGNNGKVIVVCGFHLEGRMCPQHVIESRNRDGDAEFLRVVEEHLTGELEHVGKSLLCEVRKFSNGALERGKSSPFFFIERPDNFWTVRIQPRDKSLVVTVRGEPEYFAKHGFTLARDRVSYSRFKIRNAQDLEDAVRIIRVAKRRSKRQVRGAVS